MSAHEVQHNLAVDLARGTSRGYAEAVGINLAHRLTLISDWNYKVVLAKTGDDINSKLGSGRTAPNRLQVITTKRLNNEDL
jgi:hypothetical protein